MARSEADERGGAVNGMDEEDVVDRLAAGSTGGVLSKSGSFLKSSASLAKWEMVSVLVLFGFCLILSGDLGVWTSKVQPHLQWQPVHE